MMMRAWCVNDHDGKPKWCLVESLDIPVGWTDGSRFWVATYCNDRPTLYGPISFRVHPPHSKIKPCQRCLAKWDKELRELGLTPLTLIPPPPQPKG